MALIFLLLCNSNSNKKLSLLADKSQENVSSDHEYKCCSYSEYYFWTHI